MSSFPIHLTGKHIDIGSNLKDHVQKAFDHLGEKYQFHFMEIHVVISKETHGVETRVHIQLPRSIQIHGHGRGDNPYASFDDASHHIESRFRRYKKRIHDHHKHKETRIQTLEAQSYVLSPHQEEEDDHQAETPLIIAEMTTEIPSLTVSEAVMRMDLEAAHVFVFRHKKHGGINVVYRRSDHHIGWIDPSLKSQ